MRPDFMSVGGYDGMHLIYEALKKTNGAIGGDEPLSITAAGVWHIHGS
jgi:branched-chain amino acid transport system substrate-binding protein